MNDVFCPIYDHMSGLKVCSEIERLQYNLQSHERTFIKFSLDEYLGVFLFLDLYFLINVTKHKIAVV